VSNSTYTLPRLLLIMVAMFMKPHMVDIEVSDTVKILKECIEDVCGHPTENMRLITNSGRGMRDDRKAYPN
jgi:hypothetical protein